MHTDLVAALDIGGTKIAGAPWWTAAARSWRARSARHARTGERRHVMRAVEEVLGGADRVRRCGGACGPRYRQRGPGDASAGTVSPVNVPGWRDYPLVDRVRRRGRRTAGRADRRRRGDHGGRTLAGRRPRARQRAVHGGVHRRGRRPGTRRPTPPGSHGQRGPHRPHQRRPRRRRVPCRARGCVERFASGPNIARRALEDGWRPAHGEESEAAAVAGPPARATRSPWPPTNGPPRPWPRASRPPRPSSRSTSR